MGHQTKGDRNFAVAPNSSFNNRIYFFTFLFSQQGALALSHLACLQQSALSLHFALESQQGVVALQSLHLQSVQLHSFLQSALPFLQHSVWVLLPVVV
jgi:hypothetical protein